MTMSEEPRIVMKPNFNTVSRDSEIWPLCNEVDKVVLWALGPLADMPDEELKEVAEARMRARDIIRVAYALGNLRAWKDMNNDISALIEVGEGHLEALKEVAGIDC
jgi:hypothetical protein